MRGLGGGHRGRDSFPHCHWNLNDNAVRPRLHLSVRFAEQQLDRVKQRLGERQ